MQSAKQQKSKDSFWVYLQVYFFTGQTSIMQVCKTLGFARVIPIQRKPDPTFKLKKKKTLITVKIYICVKCNIKGT